MSFHQLLLSAQYALHLCSPSSNSVPNSIVHYLIISFIVSQGGCLAGIISLTYTTTSSPSRFLKLLQSVFLIFLSTLKLVYLYTMEPLNHSLGQSTSAFGQSSVLSRGCTSLQGFRISGATTGAETLGFVSALCNWWSNTITLHTADTMHSNLF